MKEIKCPVCDDVVELDDDDVEGAEVTCDECGAELVLAKDGDLEVLTVVEEDEDDEEDEDFKDEDEEIDEEEGLG